MKMTRDNESMDFQQLHLIPDMLYSATILRVVPTNNVQNEENQEC